MPYATSGGAGNVTSAQIVDATIATDDIGDGVVTNAKLAVGAAIRSVETTAGATHSLTTVADQVVVVFAKCWIEQAGTATQISLKYGGVTKDVITADGTANPDSKTACLMYTETPGAATADITVDDNGVGTLSDIKIIVFKF